MIRRDSGLSLVELLVALLLGIILLTGVGSLLLSTNKTYVLQDELVRMQENARATLEILTRDIRMTAYTGCPSWVNLGNALVSNKQNGLWMTHFDKGVLGIPAGESVKSMVDEHAISESLVVHKLDWDQNVLVASHDADSATVTLKSSHDFNQGDLLALVSQDCDQVSVFIANFNTLASKVDYESTPDDGLYNCTRLQKGSFNCMSSQQGEGIFDHSNSQLMPVSSVAYYIRESNTIPTLYRKRAGQSISGHMLSAEALVEGIESLRILYGYDSDNDGVVNQYRSSSDIALYSENWKNVTSVKIEILVRSTREISSQVQNYFFAGENIKPEDKFIRRTFVTTVEQRNRGN